jgi:hypothetical protein
MTIRPSKSVVLKAKTLAIAEALAADACRKELRKMIAVVHDVRKYRQMNAAEPPAQQDAWDRLQIAVLEAERLLTPPLRKEKTNANPSRDVHRKRR